MSVLNDETAPGSNPDAASFDTTHTPNDTSHLDPLRELQAREMVAAQELEKVCHAIGAQAGAIAVMAMASTLAKASAARMVAERQVRE